MNVRRLGKVHRALRQRLGYTQAEVSRMAKVQRNKISELENGIARRLTLVELERCFESMDANVRVFTEWHGAALDRLLDEGHAMLVGQVASELRRLAWVFEFEVSFARGYDRGSIDILAWHQPSKTLLVIEVKSVLGAIDGLLRPLDIKMRVCAAIAAERFGWQTRVVAKLVVLPADSTVRRAVRRHAQIMDVALPARTREMRAWLREPSGPIAGLMFLSASQLVGTKRNPSSVRRVRRARHDSDSRPRAA